MYLYGAGGHCKVIIEIISESKAHIIEGIVDDVPKEDSIYDIPVLNTKKAGNFADKNFIISIGNNKTRKTIVESMSTAYLKAIHPKSIISSRAKINEGTVVMAGAIINSETTVGKHCIINTGAVVDHDCSIGDFVHISPNASLAGEVQVGEGTHIGIGSVIIQGIKIGKWATIGAGAVIINDIPDYAVVVGNPGKIIKYNIENE